MAPRATRPISTGCWIDSILTQRTWAQGFSSSGATASTGGSLAGLLKKLSWVTCFPELPSSVFGVRASRSTCCELCHEGGSQGRPRISQASTGIVTHLRVCMLSRDQSPFARRKTSSLHLYRRTIPTNESDGCTWWI